jgi:hypothetical protein
MADKKISALNSATTPLAGTEVLPIVQGGSTVKVPVSDLTAGRALSATSFTASTGGVVIGTSGQGVNFSATPHAAGMTSETLADYEEGTWVPVLTNWTGTLGSFAAYYTKVGRLVTVFAILVPTTTLASTVASSTVSGLPFAPLDNGNIVSWSVGYVGAANAINVSSNLFTPTIGATAGAIYLNCTYRA